MIARVKLSEAIRLAQANARDLAQVPTLPKEPRHQLAPEDYEFIKRVYFGKKIITGPQVRDALEREHGRHFSIVTIYRAIRKLEIEAIKQKRRS
jgi:hypothetical protein